MNKIINSENTLGTQVENVTNAFIELENYVNNYFDNLDVQDEINNKLNEMTESGILQNILAENLNITFTFNTTSEMLQNQFILINQKIKTLGFYEIGDGGEGNFFISNTILNSAYLQLDNGLYANFINKNNEINIKQLGAKPNDENFDNTNIIQKCLDLQIKTIIGNNENEIFYINSSLRFYNHLKFNSYVKLKVTDGSQEKRMFYIENTFHVNNIIIENPLLDGNRNNNITYPSNLLEEYAHGINIRSSNNIIIKGGNIINCAGDGICVSLSNDNPLQLYSENIIIENTKIDYCYRNGISFISSKNTKVKDCNIINRNGYRAILQEPNPYDDYVAENFEIDGGYYESNANTAVIEWNCQRDIINPSIKNCTVVNNGSVCILRGVVNDNYSIDTLTINNVKLINNKVNGQILITTKNDFNLNNLEIIKNKNILYCNLTSLNKNINFENIKVYGEEKINFRLHCENGLLKILNNFAEEINNTLDLGTGFITFKAKSCFIENNYFEDFSNCFSLTSNCEFINMSNNYLKSNAANQYTRALIIQNDLTLNTLIVDKNICDGTNANYIFERGEPTIINKRGDYYTT